MPTFAEVKKKFIQYMSMSDASYKSIASIRNGVHTPAQLADYIMQVRECNLQHLKQLQLSGDEEAEMFREDLHTMFSDLDVFMQQTIACMHERMAEHV